MNIKGAFSGYSSDNIDACKEFYGVTLGLELSDEMGGIGFNVNGQQVFIYPKEDHQPATFTVLNFVVDDIDVTVDELVGKGVVFERYDNMPAKQDERGVLRGKDAGMGPNIAWFKDPSSNILAIVEE
ncbi:MAG TPA: VOC family protein [Candidatus Saccharimonadales bacterium]